jgi:hypothetical protein
MNTNFLFFLTDRCYGQRYRTVIGMLHFNILMPLLYGGGEKRVQILVGKPEGKRPLGRPTYRWEDNNKMQLQEVGCGGID